MQKLLLAWSLLAIGNQGFRLQPTSVKSELDGKESRPKVQPYQALMPLLVALNPSPSNAFVFTPGTPTGRGSGVSTIGDATVVSRGGTSEMIDRGSKVRVLRPGSNWSQEVGTVAKFAKGDHEHPVVVRFEHDDSSEFWYANFALEELDEVDPPVATAKKATRSGEPVMSVAGSDEQDEVVADAVAEIGRDGGKSVWDWKGMEKELGDAAVAIKDVVEDADAASAAIDFPEVAAFAKGGEDDAFVNTVQYLSKVAADWGKTVYRNRSTRGVAALAGIDLPGDNDAFAHTVQDLSNAVGDWADTAYVSPSTKGVAAFAGIDIPEVAAVAEGGDNHAFTHAVQDLSHAVADWADAAYVSPAAKGVAAFAGIDIPEVAAVAEGGDNHAFTHAVQDLSHAVADWADTAYVSPATKGVAAFAGIDIPEVAAVAEGGDDHAFTHTMQDLSHAVADWADTAYMSPSTKGVAAFAGIDIPEVAAVAEGGDNHAFTHTVQDLSHAVADWADAAYMSPHTKAAAASAGIDIPQAAAVAKGVDSEKVGDAKRASKDQ